MRASALSLAAGIVAAGPGWAASFHGFDLPSGLPICGRAIASDGTVVGGPLLMAGRQPAQTAAPNFTYRQAGFSGHGSFSYPAPGIAGTVALTGVNRHHTVLGFATTVSGDFRFTYTPFKLNAGQVQRLMLPGATVAFPAALNDAGAVAGFFQTAASTGSRGFLLDRGTLTVLDDGTGGTTPEAMDASGTRVVGYSLSLQGAGLTVWRYSSGRFTQLPALAALNAFPFGVDTAGRITGTYITGTYPQEVGHGFVYADGHIETLDVPGASYTIVSGLNEHGQFTGCYIDGHGTHGLLGQL